MNHEIKLIHRGRGEYIAIIIAYGTEIYRGEPHPAQVCLSRALASTQYRDLMGGKTPAEIAK